MAAAELIPIGTVDADSADIAVIAGTPVTVFLKATNGANVDSQARAVVKIKTSGATYQVVGNLNATDRIAVIDGPGTYRVSKFAGPSFGVEQG